MLFKIQLKFYNESLNFFNIRLIQNNCAKLFRGIDELKLIWMRNIICFLSTKKLIRTFLSITQN